tara:strand:- start:769 stop:1380 length:612 start_codon:yes stop_codon:yes gene_type:complete
MKGVIMDNKHSILYLILVLVVINCGAKSGPNLSPDASKKTIMSSPDWFLNPPYKEGFKSNASSATSQDMQLAIDKARTSASTTLAGMIESEWNALIKRLQEETGLEENSKLIDQFSSTQEQVISKRLNDINVSKREVMEEKTDDGKKIYRAYVLVEYDEGAAQKRMLEQIKADEQLYNAMRATELYEEMNKKVEEYRKRYSNE